MASNENTQNLSEIQKLLQNNVGKEILVKLKNNISVRGKLGVFDQHLNLTLKKGEILFGEKNEIFDSLLVRGADVVVISVLDNNYSKK